MRAGSVARLAGRGQDLAGFAVAFGEQGQRFRVFAALEQQIGGLDLGGERGFGLACPAFTLAAQEIGAPEQQLVIGPSLARVGEQGVDQVRGVLDAAAGVGHVAGDPGHLASGQHHLALGDAAVQIG